MISPKEITNLFPFILGIATFLLFGCSNNYLPLETVKQVDIHKYMGKWYEIARFPNSFQKDCNCTTAEYQLMEDYVKVTNSCYKDSINGTLETAIGKATVVEGSNNAKLRVSFFWPFKGDYWVIDLADDYSCAVIGTPSRKYLWILSRTPAMNPAIYQQILSRITAKGFDINKLIPTKQF